MDVILYSTGCPKCTVLKKKLDISGIEYEENNNVDEMQRLGIMEMPMLFVDDKMMNFFEATQWANSRGV